MELIIYAFTMGLTSAFSACVYPMIPITTSIFGAGNTDSLLRGFILSSTYVLGMAVTYTALMVITALSSGVFGSYLGSPYVQFGFGLLFFLLGLAVIDVLPLPLNGLANKIQVKNKGTYFYPFTMGLVSAFIVAPCVAPFVISVIAQVAAQGQKEILPAVFQGMSFSLGLGLPFLLIGGLSMRLPKPGKWLQAVKYLGAAILFAFACSYFIDAFKAEFIPTNQVYSFALVGFFVFIVFFILAEPLKIIETGKKMAKVNITLLLLIAGVGLFVGTTSIAKSTHDEKALAEMKGQWHTSLDSAMRAARGNDSRILIDFWATWCAACFEMERELFTSKDFKELVKENNLTLARLDFTEQTDDNLKIAEKYAIMGLPTLVLATRDGKFIDSIIGFRSKQISMKALGYALKRKLPEKTEQQP